MAVAVVVSVLLTGRCVHAGTVTDCGDTPAATTTLRGVIAGAADGDPVDVSQCPTITLLSGEISTALNLTIQGPPDGTTTIDANLSGRALNDTGAGSVLTLDHVRITHGRAPGLDPFAGGCVLATYKISLTNSTLSDCAATTNDGTARGGAINAFIVALTSSVVEDSNASSANKDAQGGGVYAGSQFFCTDSLVRNGTALAGDFLNGHAYGGGVYTPGSMTIAGCTFAGNQASDTGGGLWAGSIFMYNSTVSGNSVTYNVGGIAATAATISNSTIAFNHGGTCGGLFAGTVIGSYINSSILANNSATTASACHDVNAGFGPGTNNIVGVADAGVTLPGDTYVGDPQLTPLGDHGGPTPTHALSPASYAIDHGNNTNGFPNDQRGGGYDRVVNGSADVGAYERQLLDDEIFYNGLE